MLATASLDELRAAVREARAAGKRIGCVPTMGALHAGHLSLMRSALNETDYVVVTIFVNPTQFGPNEDFDRYPRQLDKDLELCRGLGVHCVFHPDVQTMYPPDDATIVEVQGLSTILEGEHRPGHFRGVTTVVTKLFHAVQPDVAFFGQKDFQQQLILRRMARDLLMPIRIRTCPTVRDPDGLALSSRNAYLTADERRTALNISRALFRAREAIESGELSVAEAEKRLVQVLSSVPGLKLDYAVIRNAETLDPAENTGDQLVGLVAARVGTTRLIDNVLISPPGTA